jgi:outer membrane protein, heavy metal efflux system
VLAMQHEALRELARVDGERFREGLVAEAVAIRTSLEADRLRVTVVNARNEALQARAELARLLGVVTGPAPTPDSLVAPLLPPLPDSLVAVSTARMNRPELQARELAVLEAQRRLSAEQRATFGEVQLQGGTKETGGFMTGQLGVAMPLPLFNRNSAARQRASGELLEARALRDDAQAALLGMVRAAWQYYAEVRATASDAATFETRGREVARIARVAYLEGQLTLTELLDAERAAADARLAHAQWAADAWLARLGLERAMGARLDDASPFDLPRMPGTSPARP